MVRRAGQAVVNYRILGQPLDEAESMHEIYEDDDWLFMHDLVTGTLVGIIFAMWTALFWQTVLGI